MTDGTPIEIAWITDTHVASAVDGRPDASGAVSDFDDGDAGPRLYYTGADKVRQFVDIVNDLDPHLAIHTGDAIEGRGGDADLDLFLDEWSRIDDGVRTELLRGNHDTNEDFVPMIGYDDRAKQANSVFNRSFRLETGDAAARIITYDTHLTDDGEFVYATDRDDEYGYAGQAPDFLVEWLREELLAADEETILCFSHAGPHVPDGRYFDVEAGQTVRTMIHEEVVPQRPDTDVYALFGHHHGALGIEEFSTVGPDAVPSPEWPGLLNACAVNRETSSCGVLRVEPNGSLTYEERELEYPHPGDGS